MKKPVLQEKTGRLTVPSFRVNMQLGVFASTVLFSFCLNLRPSRVGHML